MEEFYSFIHYIKTHWLSFVSCTLIPNVFYYRSLVPHKVCSYLSPTLLYGSFNIFSKQFFIKRLSLTTSHTLLMSVHVTTELLYYSRDILFNAMPLTICTVSIKFLSLLPNFSAQRTICSFSKTNGFYCWMSCSHFHGITRLWGGVGLTILTCISFKGTSRL